MRLIGVEDVESHEGSTLHLGPNDRITPLARDRAIELGVRLESGSSRVTSSPIAVHQSPARAIRNPLAAEAPSQIPFHNELFRRSVPTAGHRSSPATMGGRGSGRVVVVGAGHVGTSVATFLAQSDLFEEIVLVDIAEGLPTGMSLDLSHAASLRGFGTRVRGCADLGEAGAADFVVVTAGRPRKPGMDRSDLAVANGAIVGAVCEDIARISPDAVVIVVTNPLDEITHLAWKTTGFPDQRVIGMAGVLDTARFCAFAAERLSVRPDEVEAVALGSHGGEMVIPLSQCRVRGVPIASMLEPDSLADLVKRTRDAGAEIVGHLGTGSAYIAPGASVARMLTAMRTGSREVMPACVRSRGAYGLADVHVGLPTRLGPTGVEEVVDLDLEPGELAALAQAANRIRDRLAGGS